tara:strand:- start:692 stop:895 length:204 start_codon:yes stop_codon:yes gene_type:complete
MRVGTVLLVSAVLLLGLRLQARSWTSTDGKAIETELLHYDAASGIVKLQISTGAEYQLAESRLSGND